MCAGKFSQCLNLTFTKFSRSKHPCGIKDTVLVLGMFDLQSNRSSSPFNHATFAPSMFFWRRSYIYSRALETYKHSKAFVLNIGTPANKGIILSCYRLLYICIAQSGCLRGWSQCFVVYANNSVSFFSGDLFFWFHYFETIFIFGVTLHL